MPHYLITLLILWLTLPVLMSDFNELSSSRRSGLVVVSGGAGFQIGSPVLVPVLDLNGLSEEFQRNQRVRKSGSGVAGEGRSRRRV